MRVGEVIVMNHAIHKIAFVCDHGNNVCFIVKRPGSTAKHTYNCHLFDAGSSKTVSAEGNHHRWFPCHLYPLV